MANVLALARVARDDLVLDLGCGDGRVVLAARARARARAASARIRASSRSAARARAPSSTRAQRGRARFAVRDFRELGDDPIFAAASVIYTYLLPAALAAIEPM